MVFPSVCDNLKVMKVKPRPCVLAGRYQRPGAEAPSLLLFCPEEDHRAFLWSSSIWTRRQLPLNPCLASQPQSGEAEPAFPPHAMTCMYVHQKENTDSIWPPSCSDHVLLPNLCAKILGSFQL